jgi:hypothetical protein
VLARNWRSAIAVAQVELGMAIAGQWQPLTPTVIASLPEAMAAFEIGSLVRTVLYIGGDPNEGLQSAVRRALATANLRLRAHCIRWELTTDPRGRSAELLAAHRAAHGGATPAEQPRSAPAVRVFLPAPAETRSAPAASALDTKKRSPAAASFLRVRTVA